MVLWGCSEVQDPSEQREKSLTAKQVEIQRMLATGLWVFSEMPACICILFLEGCEQSLNARSHICFPLLSIFPCL